GPPLWSDAQYRSL
ncbi:solute symporter family protein, partial [Vibrio parahaemolyticus V-223/04]